MTSVADSERLGQKSCSAREEGVGCDPLDQTLGFAFLEMFGNFGPYLRPCRDYLLFWGGRLKLRKANG